MSRLLDVGERIFIAMVFARFAVIMLSSSEHDPRNLLFLAVSGLVAAMVLFRPRNDAISLKSADWLLALAGGFLSFLYRPEPGLIGPDWLATVLLWAGMLIACASKLSLNRRFGFVPGNRGVQSNWAYSLVRHPMYLGYAVADVGFLMINPSVWNLALFVTVIPLQLARIWREEAFLSQDAAYIDYKARVRYRLVPGLY